MRVNGPTIGGFLYLTLAALAAGMVASTVRWMLIDTIHHATGIRRPNWNNIDLLIALGWDFLPAVNLFEQSLRQHQQHRGTSTS